MEVHEFHTIVKKNEIKVKRGKHLLFAFLFGGSMGLLSEGIRQFLFRYGNFSLEDAGLISTLEILVIVTLLTMLGSYKTLAKKAGAGLFIPTSGFANSVVSSAMEAKVEGPIYGVGARMFYLAGSVLTYGIVGSFFYALLRLLLSYIGVSL